MKYLKDTMTKAVRAFDEKIPKQARKYKTFLKAKLYSYDSDENTITATRGGRWVKATKKDYDTWVKQSKPVDVEVSE